MLQRQTLHHGDVGECIGTCRRQAVSSGRYSRPFERDAPYIQTSAMVHSDEPFHNTCVEQNGRSSHYALRETRGRRASCGETATTDETSGRRLRHSLRCRANMKTRNPYVEGECNSGHDRRSPGLRHVPMPRHMRCRDRNLQSRSRLRRTSVCATVGRHVVVASWPPGTAGFLSKPGKGKDASCIHWH